MDRTHFASLLSLLLLAAPVGIRAQTTRSGPGAGQAQEAQVNSTSAVSEEKKGEWLLAPIPINSPAIGAGLAWLVARVFPLNKRDDISPPSIAGVGGVFTNNEIRYIKGQMFLGSVMTAVDNEATGHIKALDVRTGQVRWEKPTRSPMLASVLATGGGIGFTGDPEGYFLAFDLETGDFLWRFQCGSGHHGSPITFELDGKQCVAVCIGWGGPEAKYRGGAPWFADIPKGCAVYVFALNSP